MAFAIPSDNLDPIVAKIGRFIGLLDPIVGNEYPVNDAWFTDSPLEHLTGALSDPDKQQVLIELLGDLLEVSDGQTEGLPGPNANETWYPIKKPEVGAADSATGLYIVIRQIDSDASILFGVGVRWQDEVGDIKVSTWANLPIVRTNGSTGGTSFALGQDASPVQLALEVSHDSRFGNDSFGFSGLKLSGQIFFAKAPAVSFEFLDLKLPDEASPSNRSLADLIDLPSGDWVDMAIALFTAQLAEISGDTNVTTTLDHLLPMLGLGGTLPTIRWEQFPADGVQVVKDWVLTLVQTSAHIEIWLGHWKQLLVSGGGSPLDFDGSGSRAEPYRAGVKLSASVELYFTVAKTVTDAGHHTFYPGLQLSSPASEIGSGSGIKVALESAIEFVSLPLTGTGIQPLPAFSARLRLFRESGGLVSHNFATSGGPLASLGNFSVAELRAGLRLNADQRPVPHVELVNVTSGLGNWPTLDLSAADTVLDGLGDIVEGLIQQQLQNLLVGDTVAIHAGRHLAAVFGLMPPTSAGAPTPWPVDLVVNSSKITTFLGNPLAAIGCYHAACLEIQDGGAPVWRFLIPDLMALLRHTSAPAPTLTGNGSKADPWATTLYEAATGRAQLLCHSALVGGRPQLVVALALQPNAIPLGGDGVELGFDLNVQCLSLDLPPSADCSGSTQAVWMNGLSGTARIVDDSGPMQIPTAAGLSFEIGRIELEAMWTRIDGLDWALRVEDLQAAWTGDLAASLSLPNLNFGGDFDLDWDLSRPDFGLGLDANLLGDFIRFSLGGWLLNRGGSFGFGFAGLLGLLPNVPNISLPGLPAWNTGPFALPSNWPKFEISGTWPDFFADPWPDLSLHFGRLFADPSFAWPTLRWLSGSLFGSLPNLSLPDIGWPNFGGDGTAFPDLGSLPIQISGGGIYDNPWAIKVNRSVAQHVELLIWLEPDGPASGEALDVVLSLLPADLQNLDDLIGNAGISFENLLQIAERLTDLDAVLKTGLAGVGLPELSAALDTLTVWLNNSDGVVLTVSQQILEADGSSWNTPVAAESLPEAHHGAQLSHADIINRINTEISNWGADLPVLLVGAPWEGLDVWDEVLASFGSPTVSSFDFRETGVDPDQISLETNQQVTRFYTADIAVFNTAPGIPPESRAIPVDVSGDTEAASQAKQIDRLINRIRVLHGGKKVIVVAHSTTGLACRAAINRDVDGSRVRGIITVGTPHYGSDVTWVSDTAVHEALAFLQRVNPEQIPNQHIRDALGKLFALVNGSANNEGGHSQFPTHAFDYAGSRDLPGGVDGVALASRLPSIALKDQIVGWLQGKVAALRTLLDGRDDVTHIGLGVRLQPPATTESSIRLETTVRADLLRVAVTGAEVDSSDYVALPRVSLVTKITHTHGWLVGGVGTNPRLRCAEIGVIKTPDAVLPQLRLHDGYIDGVGQALSTLDALSERGFDPQATVPRLMDALMAALTRGDQAVPTFDKLAQLLGYLGLSQTEGSGYAFDPDGWQNLFADPESFLTSRFQALLTNSTNRQAFFAKLFDQLGIDGSALPFSLLTASDSDDSGLTVLREVLAVLGVTLPASQGYTVSIPGLLALLDNPAEQLRSRIDALLTDETKRTQLLQFLRSTFDLDDFSKPLHTVTVSDCFTLTVLSTGKLTLGIAAADALQVIDEIGIYGSITLDLANRAASVDIKCKPRPINLAVAAALEFSVVDSSVAADWAIRLDWADLAQAFPFEPLDIYPLPADFVTRLGQMVPRFVLSTVAAPAFESLLFENAPSAGPLFDTLGLAWRENSDSPWRLRALEGLISDPVGWLTSKAALATDDDKLDIDALVSVVNHLATLLDISGGPGTINLPFGMQLTATHGDGFELGIGTNTPLLLSGSDTLALLLKLTLSDRYQVGVGAQLTSNFDLSGAPSGWDSLHVSSGFENGDFNLSFGGGDVDLQLIPFPGWQQAILGSAGGTAKNLLPTMIEALLEALEAEESGVADVQTFIANLKTAADRLNIDTVAKLQSLISDPVGWLQTQFNVANASDVATAIHNLLSPHLGGLISSAGQLVYTPGGIPIEIKVGRGSGVLGVWLSLTDLETGPIQTTVSASLTIDDTVNPSPDIGLGVELQLIENVIAPGGVSIQPQLNFSFSGSGPAFSLQPVGDLLGNDNFKLSILPGPVAFQLEADALAQFALNVLAPIAIETLLNNNEVSSWLNSDVLAGVKPGDVFVAAKILSKDGSQFGLRILAEPLSGEDFVAGLLGAALDAVSGHFTDNALVEIENGGLYIAKKSAGSAGNHYGLRLKLPQWRLSEDPELVLQLGDDADWLEGAGVDGVSDGGITLYLLTVNHASHSFGFKPTLALSSIGIDVSGRNDDPLLQSGSFRLGGINGRIYLDLNLVGGVDLTVGGMLDIREIGIPLGAGGSNSNPIAGNMLSSDNNGGGENESVNPGFNATIAYVNEFSFKLSGRDAEDDEIWFPIQRSFGPIYIGQIGVGWQASDKLLKILIDGGATISGLSVAVDDLSIGIPLGNPSNFNAWKLGLKGLAINYEESGFKISGALLKAGDDPVVYNGVCLVEVGGQTFSALGSYAEVSSPGGTYPSMFVFVLLPMTLGGPPYFFVTGLAGGFGYNRSLVVPEVDKVPDFALVRAANGSLSADFSDSEGPPSAGSLLRVLEELNDAVPIQRGAYWLSGGVRFTSFELVQSVALVYVLLDRGFEIGLLGLSQLELPRGKPLANIEMALKARFSTVDGLMSIEARLTDNSWLLSRDCRLTGGFAFYLWFGGSHQGDFVITMGGYHPRFVQPAHYPDVPRLGFNWRVSSKVTIKGESYFALTPSCVMAGGLLEASYKSGNLKAWFKAWAHFLIAWKPFAYDIEIGISIGVSYRLKINLLFGSITKTFKVELGASVWIWGPELTGKVKVTWWVISFTFRFGANDNKVGDAAIPWDDFRTEFLPADADLFDAQVVTGLIEVDDDSESTWQLQPEFTLRTETILAASHVHLQDETAGGSDHYRRIETEIDIKPMHLNDVTSVHRVTIKEGPASGGGLVTDGVIFADSSFIEYRTVNGSSLQILVESSQAPAALWDFDGQDEKAAADTVQAVVGLRIVAEIDETALSSTGDIPVFDIYERGYHPLPFHHEIDLRDIVRDWADNANVLAQHEIADSRVIMRAVAQLQSSGWDHRRNSVNDLMESLGANVQRDATMAANVESLLGQHSAPPQIRSLYAGMASEPAFDQALTPVDVIPPQIKLPVARIPKLTAVLRQSAEPTRATGQVAKTAIDETLAGRSLPRIDMSNQSKRQTQPRGASIKRVTVPQAHRATTSSTRGVEMVAGFARRDIRAQFETIESAAVKLVSPQMMRNAASILVDVAEQQNLNRVQAGTTQVWSIPCREASGSMPVVQFSGDQAVRITALNRGGALLADREFAPGQGQWQLPQRAASVAITGLGRPADWSEKNPHELTGSMGGISLLRASNQRPIVGWQLRNQLVQVSRSSLAGRGVVLKLPALLNTRRRGSAVQQSLISAANALVGQLGVETQLPQSIDVVGILVERHETAHGSSLADALSLSAEGCTLSDKPTSVTSHEKVMLLYDLRDKDDSAEFLSISVGFKPGWQLHGVFGMQGDADQWARTLSRGLHDSLVENGPLTPQGVTHLMFQVEDVPAEPNTNRLQSAQPTIR